VNLVSGDARFYGAAGGAGLFLGVAFGAFAAHTLRTRISSEMIGVFETGVRYQMYHSLALLAVALFADRGKMFRYAGTLYILGIVLFSFSLYALAMTGGDRLGIITPFGGLSFLAGHIFLVLGFLRL
jgi:uncharacterized membrane protein YgdD (TMEM256/DUF423 family)